MTPTQPDRAGGGGEDESRSRATKKRCDHGFDWRNQCPHGCVSDVTTAPHCEFEVHCDFGSGGAAWFKFDTIDQAKAFVANPWTQYPHRTSNSFGACRMTLYRRIVEPWERLEEWTDHEGWHRV